MSESLFAIYFIASLDPRQLARVGPTLPGVRYLEEPTRPTRPAAVQVTSKR